MGSVNIWSPDYKFYVLMYIVRAQRGDHCWEEPSIYPPLKSCFEHLMNCPVSHCVFHCVVNICNTPCFCDRTAAEAGWPRLHMRSVYCCAGDGKERSDFPNCGDKRVVAGIWQIQMTGPLTEKALLFQPQCGRARGGGDCSHHQPLRARHPF